MKVKNYSIHPSVYFIVAALLIAYFFPREGKFRYQFYEGKPWRYGLLTAPSDFPIYKTDVALRRALKAETGSATVIIVAQRLSTILHADQILVLDGGRIVGRGTHSALLRSCETYREIALSQLSAAELGEEG